LIVNQPMIRTALRFVVCAAVLLVVAYLYTSVLRVATTTVALTLLIWVLIVSAVWSLR